MKTAKYVAILLASLATIGAAGRASGQPPARTAEPTTRYICAQAFQGAALPATHENIMRGACVLSDDKATQETNSEVEHWHALAVKRLALARKFERQRNRIRRVVRMRAHRSVWNGLTCIHHFEGAWNDSGDPYWGGLQMDRGFMRTYGSTLHGYANAWPAELQLAVGVIAFYSGRGYGPWPNTRRMCGL